MTDAQFLEFYGVTGDGPVLSWKDEGRAGPAMFYASAAAFVTAVRPRPAGEVFPEDAVRELGWMTRASARREARRREATFVEF